MLECHVNFRSTWFRPSGKRDQRINSQGLYQRRIYGTEDALLAESLITKGAVYCELKRYNEAQKAFDGAYRLARRCGDLEGAGRATLILVEKLSDMLAPEERSRVRMILAELLANSQQPSIKSRASKCLEIIDPNPRPR